jgi:quercetin dioxygenase-like cupin family protein
MVRLLPTLLLLVILSTPVCALETTGVAVETLARGSVSWEGTELPAYPQGQPQVTILRIRIPPGTTLPMHTHPVINAGVLISGALTVITEKNETLRLKAGDPIIEVVDKWHYGKNEGTEPADIIVFYAGTTESPLSVKRGSE